MLCCVFFASCFVVFCKYDTYARLFFVLADSLLGVGEAALDEGDLRPANSALLAEASLALGGLVTVKVLLAGAPVENLEEETESERAKGEDGGMNESINLRCHYYFFQPTYTNVTKWNNQDGFCLGNFFFFSSSTSPGKTQLVW